MRFWTEWLLLMAAGDLLVHHESKLASLIAVGLICWLRAAWLAWLNMRRMWLDKPEPAREDQP